MLGGGDISGGKLLMIRGWWVGKDTLFIGHPVWRYQRLHRRFENLAVRLQLPRFPFLRFVLPIKMEWSNPLFTFYPEIGPNHMKKPD